MLRGTMRILALLPFLLVLPWLAGCAEEQPPVMVQVQPYMRAVFTWKTPLAGTEAVSEKQAALYKQLAADPVFKAAPPQIIAAEKSVTFRTGAKDQATAEKQLATATRTMEKVFGKGHFAAPTAAEVFHPVNLALQREVGDVLTARLKNLGIKATVEPAAGGRLKIMPNREIGDREMKALTTTGRFELWLLPREISVSVENGKVTATRNGITPLTITQVLQAGYLVLDGSTLKVDSDIAYSANTRPAIAFSVKPEAQKRLGAITAGHVGYQMMIVVDGEIIMAPAIRAQITDAGIIEGHFTKDEAQEYANLLSAGQLPAEVTVVETP